MWRALILLVMVVGGAAALIHGLDIRRQLRSQLDEGVGGTMRSALVAVSSDRRQEVGFYRTLSLVLIAGGGTMLVAALAVGFGGVAGSAKNKAKDKAKDKAKEKRPPRKRR